LTDVYTNPNTKSTTNTTNVRKDSNRIKQIKLPLFLDPLKEEEDEVSSATSSAKVTFVNKKNKFRKKLYKLFTNQRFHVTIIVLVVIVCLFIAGEIIIENVKMNINVSNR
jgi:hypothetical protein